MQSLVLVLLGAATTTSALSLTYPTQNNTCAHQPALPSCPSANSTAVDSCCVETFGGLLLSTQLWSTYTGLESAGQFLPAKTWGLHGLWPDFCDGSYTQYCDLSRQYDPLPSPNTTNGLPNGTVVEPWKGPGIDSFIKNHTGLLQYMDAYWIAQNQDNAGFWAHEFSKHATCMSTFASSCFANRTPHSDIVDYFHTVIATYQRFPTYDWLAAASIVPSNSSTYTYATMRDVLFSRTGAIPSLRCSGPKYNETAAGAGSGDAGATVVSEVWYYEHVFGRPQEGRTVAVHAPGKESNCAVSKGALVYPERAEGSEREAVVEFEKKVEGWGW